MAQQQNGQRLELVTDVVLMRDNARKLMEVLLRAKTQGRGCAVINARHVMQTRQIHWGYLPIEKVPEAEIKQLIDKCDPAPLRTGVVVLLRPDGTRGAYIITFMVDMITQFPNDHLAILEGVAM